jgi:hypothetical protein
MLSSGLRNELLGGPYTPPPTRRGAFLTCEMRGKVKVGDYSDGPIPWPIKWKTRSLILCGALVEAVRLESAPAVAHHWGVSTWTVKKWRGALGVEAYNQGTHALMRRAAREHATPQRVRQMTTLAREAGRRPKPAAFRRLTAAIVRRRIAAGCLIHPRHRPWTSQEDKKLGTKSDEELAKEFGRTALAVRARRRFFRIPVKEATLPWTKEQEKLLGTASDAEVARRLGRGERGVQIRRQTLGIEKFGGASPSRPWKPWEDALLGKKTDREVARLLKRPLNVIQIRRYLKGIPNPASLRRIWSAAEDELLKTLPNEEVSKRTGRSLSATEHRRHSLGVGNPASKRRAWKPEEIALLGKLSDHRIALLLNCSVRQVRGMRACRRIPAPAIYEPQLLKKGFRAHPDAR